MSAPVESPLTARLSRNTLALVVSNVGGAVVLFFLSALLGRALGKDGLGVYATALAWVFPLTLLVEFGLGTLMTREIAQDWRSAHPYLEVVTRSRLLIGGVIMIALIAAAPFISSDPQIVAGLQVSAPLVIILPLYGSFTAIFRARGEMWAIPFLNIGMLIAQFILTALALLAGGGVLAAFIINVVASVGQLLVAWGIYRRRFYDSDLTSRPPLRTESESRVKRGKGEVSLLPLLRSAFPFALAALFAALQTRLTIILLDQLATTAEVGYFSAASRFVEAARTLPNAFFGALFPALALLAADRQRMARTFRRGMVGLGAFGAAAGIGFTLLALPVITLTYGDGFEPAALVLQLLGWSLLFSLLRGGRTLYLYALGYEGRVNRVNGAVIVVQGGISLLLIPAAGAPGAALAHILVEILALVLLWRNPPNARLTNTSSDTTAG